MMHFISHGQRVPSPARSRDASTERCPIARVDAWINRFLISTTPSRRLARLAGRPWREAAQSRYSSMMLHARAALPHAALDGRVPLIRVGKAALPLACFLRTSNSSRRRIFQEPNAMDADARLLSL
jgi:hypothetical protein